MKSLHREIIATTMVCSTLAGGIYSIVWSAMNWHRGIYAGAHFNDAQKTALTGLLAALDQPNTLPQITAGHPNVRNTHLLGKFGGPQIRIFRFIVNGKAWCVTTWNGDSNYQVGRCHT